MSPVDRVAHLNRWRSRSLTEKATLALGMLVLSVLLPPYPAAAVVAISMIGVSLVGARVPVRVFVACAVAPLGFLLAGAVTLVVQLDMTGLSFAPGGTAAALRLASRSVAALTCLLFLALTTPTTDLIRALRRCGLPAEITEIALLTYRFLFLLADTALNMNTAQAARLGHVGMRRRLTSLGVLIANLLPRALGRGHQLEIGLAARGWEGEMRVLGESRPVSIVGLALVLLLEAGTAALGVLVS